MKVECNNYNGLWIGIALLIIVFGGTPDLHDAILNYLHCCEVEHANSTGK